MRMEELDGAFGRAPESFRRRVRASLVTAKEGKAVKRKIGAGIVLAQVLALVLLVGVGYAVVLDWGFVDFVNQNPMIDITSDMRELLMETNDPGLTFETDGVEITVTQAIADTEYMYIAGVLRSLDPAVTLVYGYDEVPEEGGPYKYVSVVAAIEKQIKAYDIPISAAMLEWKLEDPKLGYRYTTHTAYVQRLAGELGLTQKYVSLSDGSIGFILTSPLETEAEALDIVIFGVTVDGKEVRYARESAVMPVYRERETALYAGSKSIKSGLVTVKSVEVIKTPLNAYCTVNVDIDPVFQTKIKYELQKMINPRTESLFISLYDAEGNRLQNGMALMHYGNYTHDKPYCWQSVPLETLPEAFTLKVYVVHEGVETIETLVIEK